MCETCPRTRHLIFPNRVATSLHYYYRPRSWPLSHVATPHFPRSLQIATVAIGGHGMCWMRVGRGYIGRQLFYPTARRQPAPQICGPTYRNRLHHVRQSPGYPPLSACTARAEGRMDNARATKRRWLNGGPASVQRQFTGGPACLTMPTHPRPWPLRARAIVSRASAQATVRSGSGQSGSGPC